ncbi:MAG: AarF/ABC1/UbiB kinase family protein [Candidatus Terrybacteria bacterium]|nr:AarF/ABC1/UbiB kinase family protein [Candidatus Terrybacteria bacterium]
MRIMRIANFLKRLLELNWLFFSVLFNFKLTGPVRLRIFFEQAGGAFVKLGQILALRQDFLPLPYIAELLNLRNKSLEAMPEEIEKVFLEETGRSIKDFFLEFNPQPVASGSISQVYCAKLPDGAEVAVKIQRPKIKEIFETDFILICFFTGVFDFFRLFSNRWLSEIIPEFVSWTRRDLDFTNEAKNAASLYEHSKYHLQTVIPKQYLKLTTPRVLIQEFIIDGIFANDILMKKITEEQLIEKDINCGELVNYLLKDQMRQYFIDGFFHADPHPANLIFLPGNKLVYLNFGIVGEAMKQDDRLLFLRAFYGMAKKDVDFLSRNFFEFGQKVFREEIDFFLQADLRKKEAVDKIIGKIKEIIFNDFRKKMEEIMNPWFEAIDKTNTPFLKIMRLADEYSVPFPREMILFFRSLSILDTLALQLSPDFDMIKALNLFFDDYPLEKAEELIKKGVHEKEAGDKIIPMTDVDWEFFKETSVIQKEKILAAKERMMNLILYYADKHEEIRSMIKSLK